MGSTLCFRRYGIKGAELVVFALITSNIFSLFGMPSSIDGFLLLLNPPFSLICVFLSSPLDCLCSNPPFFFWKISRIAPLNQRVNNNIPLLCNTSSSNSSKIHVISSLKFSWSQDVFCKFYNNMYSFKGITFCSDEVAWVSSLKVPMHKSNVQ